MKAAQNQTLDGGWAASIWAGDTDFASLLSGMENAATLDEQAALAQEADLRYAEQHWFIHLSGLKSLTEYYSTRLQGYDPANRLFSGKTMGTVVSTMWGDGRGVSSPFTPTTSPLSSRRKTTDVFNGEADMQQTKTRARRKALPSFFASLSQFHRSQALSLLPVNQRRTASASRQDVILKLSVRGYANQNHRPVSLRFPERQLIESLPIGITGQRQPVALWKSWSVAGAVSPSEYLALQRTLGSRMFRLSRIKLASPAPKPV